MGKKEDEPRFNPEFKKNPYPGFYIAFEGNDGSGHTTQMEIICKTFEEKNIDFAITEEPNEKYYLGDAIRFILKKKLRIHPLDFQQMYIANRYDHEEKLVIPTLKTGKTLFSDRCFLSTIAYGSLKGNTDQLIKENIEFIVPDIIFLLDTPADICIKRIKKRLEKSEKFTNKSEQDKKLELFERLSTLKKVGATYRSLSKRYPSMIKSLPGEKTIEEIYPVVFEHVSQHPKFYNSERIKS